MVHQMATRVAQKVPSGHFYGKQIKLNFVLKNLPTNLLTCSLPHAERLVVISSAEAQQQRKQAELQATRLTSTCKLPSDMFKRRAKNLQISNPKRWPGEVPKHGKSDRISLCSRNAWRAPFQRVSKFQITSQRQSDRTS